MNKIWGEGGKLVSTFKFLLSFSSFLEFWLIQEIFKDHF